MTDQPYTTDDVFPAYTDGDLIAEATLARWRDTDPDAELVQRTVHHGPWQATEAGDR